MVKKLVQPSRSVEVDGKDRHPTARKCCKEAQDLREHVERQCGWLISRAPSVAREVGYQIKVIVAFTISTLYVALGLNYIWAPVISSSY